MWPRKLLKNYRYLLQYCQLCQCNLKPVPSRTDIQQFRSKSSDRTKVADRFSWLLAEDKNIGVVEGLKKAYKTKLLPLEKFYNFHDFHSPPLSDTDFESLPQVLVIGR